MPKTLQYTDKFFRSRLMNTVAEGSIPKFNEELKAKDAFRKVCLIYIILENITENLIIRSGGGA